MQDLKIVHRDLKLENLLLSERNFKDLGLSRNLSEINLTTTICGTPLYSAPEVLSGDYYDFKAVIWSFGSILYELLTG